MAETASVLFGRFRLHKRLGAGGMGEVFRAEMLGPDGFARPVVVKRMLPDLTTEPDAVAMFIEEARLAARLLHPHICPVYDFGNVSGRYFLVMELVDGCDLARLLAHLAQEKRRLGFGATLVIVSALLEALEHAHALAGQDGRPLGLVHRDISPANILLGRAGEVKLTDFGIAKTRARMQHTSYGQIRGKIPYLSPEQADGRPLDGRSDLFSVGVVLYELLTGQRPFRAGSSDELLAIIGLGVYPAPEAVNPEVGAGLSKVVARALEKSPERRFPSAAEFRAALFEGAQADGIAADPTGLRQIVARASAAFAELLGKDPEETQNERGPRSAGTPDRTEQIADPFADRGALSPVLSPPLGPSGASPTPVGPTPAGPTPGGPTARGAAPLGPATPTYARPTDLIARGSLLRQGLSIAGIALACTVVAVVVALRLSSGGGAAAARTVRIALRMYPAQQGWFRREVFDRFAKEQGVRVDIVEFNSTAELGRILEAGEADVAKIDAEHAPLLVEKGLLRRLSDLGASTDSAAFESLLGALRPEAIELGSFTTVTGRDLYLACRKLETDELVFRPSLVRAAVLAFPGQRAALEAALRAVTGSGLPRGFVLSADPRRWSSWDLVAAAWTWARTPIRGRVAPRYGLRWGELLASAVRAGAPAESAWGPTPALVDVFTIMAVLRQLDLLQPETYQPLDHGRARELLGSGGLAAYVTNQIDVGLINGNGHEVKALLDLPGDIDVAPPPLPEGPGVSARGAVGGGALAAAAGATPAATPAAGRRFYVGGWGWGVPRNSRVPDLAMRLIFTILSQDRHAAELERFPILRVRRDVAPVWPLSRRTNEVADALFAGGGMVLLPWPPRDGEAERRGTALERAFREIVIERGYLAAPGSPRISRGAIEKRLRRLLDAG